jgi:hypothetical protein
LRAPAFSPAPIAGATLKRLALSAGINRAINIAMAIAMVAVVALAALS